MSTEYTFLIGSVLFFIIVLLIMLLIVIVADCCEKHDAKKEITEIVKKLRDLDESLQDIADQLEPSRKYYKRRCKHEKEMEISEIEEIKRS